DRKETVGHDEQVTIGRDRRHDIGQDDFLAIGRNHTITTAKDRTEEVGNNRRDKTAANHTMDIGGHYKQGVQGRQEVEAGQSIQHRTKVYEIHAAETVVLKGPGGTVRIDSSGITLDAVAIRTKGPMSQNSGGERNALALPAAPRAGQGMDQVCAMRADGSCPRRPCPCGKGGT
ncbi:bacteriophage T4 gp5 trimerisation domain-containing protein, partial [Burkholderia aenigmatica]